MEPRRLEGAHVLVTRPRERANELCALLEAEGARVTALPFLELGPPDDPGPLRAAAAQIHRYRWVLFASSAAVRALAEATREAGTFERLGQAKLAAVGPATARAMAELGLAVACEAGTSTGLGLYEAIRGELGPGDEVLLPVAQQGRRELHDALVAAGVRVTRVAAYKSEGAQVDAAALAGLVADPPRVVILASPRTAEAFLQATGDAGRGWKLIAIGPTTAAALEKSGVAAAAVADRPTPAALVDAVAREVGD